MTEINCIGDSCPIPVIKAKKALESMSKGELVVIVDNEIAAQNLEKLAGEKGCSYNIRKAAGESLFYVSIHKKRGTEDAEEHETAYMDKHRDTTRMSKVIAAITSDTMGGGDEKLGLTLLKGFIYALSESAEVPDAVIFYNKGAFFTDEDSECLEDLKILESKGAEILTCGACIDFYGLKLSVGEVTNMYVIAEKLMAAGKVVRP